MALKYMVNLYKRISHKGVNKIGLRDRVSLQTTHKSNQSIKN